MKFKPMPLQAIAEHLGGEIEGDAAQEIRRVVALDEAQPGDLTFLANPKYADKLAATRASAVIAGRDQAAPQGMTLLRVDNPYLGVARALTLMLDGDRPPPGVAEGAHVHPSADIGAGAAVMAGAYVGADAAIGPNSVVFPGAVVMERVRLGADCLLYSGVVVREECVLGDRVTLHANVTVGGDGYGFAQDGATHVKIPQIGNVVIGDDVEVGACTCIDRAALGSTIIGSGTKIDNLVMIAHGCKIGENSIIVAQSGMAGSAVLGERAILGARAGVLGHLTVGAGSLVYSRAHVTKSLPPGSTVSGNPARPHKEQLRHDATLARVEKLMRRVTELEKEVAALKGK
jgi:UDP-3-O-[3-hydroxymyristoyl] glucosamine N-acyltransferase